MPLLRPRVSTANPRFALVPDPVRKIASCLRWRGDGFQILQKQSTRWVFAYAGSDPPGCDSLVPPKVTLDLVKIRCLDNY